MRDMTKCDFLVAEGEKQREPLHFEAAPAPNCGRLLSKCVGLNLQVLVNGRGHLILRHESDGKVSWTPIHDSSTREQFIFEPAVGHPNFNYCDSMLYDSFCSGTQIGVWTKAERQWAVARGIKVLLDED